MSTPFSRDFSIIIVNWNTKDYLRRCLRSIQQETSGNASLNTEIIVVDNASGDGSLEMVQEQFPWVILLKNEENHGFARANNRGIRESVGRYTLLLNSDTEIHKGSLVTLMSFVKDNPRAGAVGARLINSDGSLQPGCHPMLTPAREFWHLMFLDNIWPRAGYPLDKWDETPRRVEAIKGACLLLKREALDQVGLLDERFHMYTEEVDLCYRLDAGGWQLWYVPTAVVTHFGGASSNQNAEEMYLELYRSKIQFYRKIGGAKLARKFKIMLTIAYLPRLLLRPKNSRYRRLLANIRLM